MAVETQERRRGGDISTDRTDPAHELRTDPAYELRPALWEDNGFLEELFADVHAAELAALHLPAAALEQLVALKFKAQRMARAAEFPDCDHSVLWAGGHRIGELLLHETEGEVRLLDVALLTAFRGEGIGTSIVEQLQNYARERGLPLRLAVEALNPAVRLFERVGFVFIGGDAKQATMEWKAEAPERGT